MSCPVCNGELKLKSLSRYLSGQCCTSCNGITFTLAEYLYFLTRSEPIEDSVEPDESELVMDEDTKHALVCSCGQLMNKYRITHKSNRRVDCCPSCHTIWLDMGEWEYLKVNHLYRCVNKLFTDSYQRKLRLESTKNILNKNFENRLGENDYEKLKEVRCWINSNPNRDILLAYLNANDPYAVGK